MAQNLQVEIEIPNWVNWLVINSSGSCIGHETEPKPCTYGTFWVSAGAKMSLYKGPKPKNWENELYTWR